MKLIIDTIITENGSHTHAILRKEFNISIVPSIGADLEDPAWKNPVRIENLTLNLEEDSYYIVVNEKYPTDKECETKKQAMLSHGWLVP